MFSIDLLNSKTFLSVLHLTQCRVSTFGSLSKNLYFLRSALNLSGSSNLFALYLSDKHFLQALYELFFSLLVCSSVRGPQTLHILTITLSNIASPSIDKDTWNISRSRGDLLCL